jgi:site-specific recombinase XerC
MLCDYLVTGGVLPINPASSVRGPKYSVERGRTSVFPAEEVRQLLDSIETDTVIGLRDRALIGVMVYSFASLTAAVSMRSKTASKPARAGCSTPPCSAGQPVRKSGSREAYSVTSM